MAARAALLFAGQPSLAVQRPRIGPHSRQRPHGTITRASGAATLEPATQQPGLIFSTGTAGAWDEAGVAHPVVRFYLGDNEQRWYMWYTGRSAACHDVDALFPASGSVGVAVSSDGVHWLRGSGPVEGARGEAKARDVGRVLGPNIDNWWWHDTCHLHAADVQILSSGSVASGTGVYWMFYSGGDYEGVQAPEGLVQGGGVVEGLRLRPGLAMSQDGRNWARIEAEHHTGALFDVGAPGEWDELFIGAPQVVAAGPRDLRMYYHAYDAPRRRWVVGLARSADGFKWAKAGPIFEGGASAGDFDGAGASNRSVVRDPGSGRYLMFYEAVAASGARSVGLAVSEDGLSGWRRHPEPVLAAAPAAAAWDGGGVGTPCAVSMAAGRWRLYYAGRPAGSAAWQGVGLALSEVDGPTFEGAPVRFKRRTGSKEA